MKTKIHLSLLCLALSIAGLHAAPLGSAIPYQGRLTDNSAAATGLFDFKFSLFDALVAGGQQGNDVPLNGVPVTNGLFVVALDFGSTAFNGDARFLEIRVSPSGGGQFVTLSPRQPLFPTPYALHAARANTVTNTAIGAAQLANGTVVRSLNGLKDAVSLVAGANVTLTPSGNTLQISAGASGLNLPFIANTSAANTALLQIGNTAPDGAGIRGLGEQYGTRGVSGSGHGIHGDGTATAGIGVYGEHWTSGNFGYLASKDYGVYGVHLAALNDGRLGDIISGVYGAAGSPNSAGVRGRHFPSGNIGLLGTATHGGDFNGHVIVRGTANAEAIVTIVGDDGSLRLQSDHTGGNVFMEYYSDGAGAGQARSAWTGFGNEGTARFTIKNDKPGGDIYLTPGTGGAVIVPAGGSMTVPVLTITGGSDLSERFDIAAPGGTLEPGMVVCIDPANPGKLVRSSKAFDRTVAGIISGANGVETGMVMGQVGTVADGKYPVALTGRVYVQADASAAPIQPGDLLTTSATPGHCQAVTDHAKAAGAIIGKAMTGLTEGKGLVLVLVSLQ